MCGIQKRNRDEKSSNNVKLKQWTKAEKFISLIKSAYK